MKLAELVSVIHKEAIRKQFSRNFFLVDIPYYWALLFSTYANLRLFTFRCVAFDKQDSIFWKHTSMFFFVSKLVEQDTSFSWLNHAQNRAEL